MESLVNETDMQVGSQQNQDNLESDSTRGEEWVGKLIDQMGEKKKNQPFDVIS